MFRTLPSSSERTDRLSTRFVVYFLAICWVLLNTGCGSSSSESSPAPLTPQQKQDLMTALEGMSAVQASIPAFSFPNHPASAKPGLRKMSEEIRTNCSAEVTRSNDRELKYLKLFGSRCPVTLVYDLEIQNLGNKESRALTWNYEVNDEFLRSLNSIDRISLSGWQNVITRVDSSGASGTFELKVSGPVRSPQLGEGTVEIHTHGNFIYARDTLRSDGLTTARFRFPTFHAELKAIETANAGNTVRRYNLNGTTLSDNELRELRARLPILMNPRSNQL